MLTGWRRAWQRRRSQRRLRRGEWRCEVCAAPLRPWRRHGGFLWARCDHCESLFLANPPSPRELRAWYRRRRWARDCREHAERFEADLRARGQWRGPGDGFMHRWRDHIERVLRLLDLETRLAGPSRRPELLDIGCGDGRWLEFMRARGFAVTGLEPNPTLARALAGRGFSVRRGEVEGQEFAPASFEGISAFHVFEHLRDLGGVLSRLRRWLKPEGWLLFEVPLSPDLAQVSHLRYLGESAWETMADRAGFEPVAALGYRESPSSAALCPGAPQRHNGVFLCRLKHPVHLSAQISFSREVFQADEPQRRQDTKESRGIWRLLGMGRWRVGSYEL